MKTTHFLQVIYGLLAVLGAALPWCFNRQYMQQNGAGFDLIHFFGQGFVNAASSSITSDLLIVAIAIFIWILAESRRIGIRFGWAFIAYSCVVAVASGLPLFLLFRERKLALTQSSSL